MDTRDIMTEELSGVVAPVLTPLAADGSLAPDRVADSVDYTLACGCHAVVAAGTGVQEIPALTPTERQTLITETVAAVDGRVPVLAGISHPSQTVVNDLIDCAEDVGVDGVVAMPPWGSPPTESTIRRYFGAIVEETDLPLLVYNNPGHAGDMRRELIRDIASLDGVEYVKETSRDWRKLSWLIERVHHEGHARVFSTMDVLLATLQAGGAGSVIPAPASAPAMEIHDAHEAGDVATAVETQRAFATFPPDEASGGLTAAVKALTVDRGVDVGPPRPPADSVGDADLVALREWADETGIPEA
ncbi:dihydrodipicolinate synthase family protein [Halobacteriales archaeon Cl-PHB]